MSNKNRKAFGYLGEEMACDYLRRNGYDILDRNFICKTGEIDIIAVRGTVLAFIEVKARTSCEFGLPCQAVNKEKQKKIRQTAGLYLKYHPYLDAFIKRMDIIEILSMKGRNYIRHLENAF